MINRQHRQVQTQVHVSNIIHKKNFVKIVSKYDLLLLELFITCQDNGQIASQS